MEDGMTAGAPAPATGNLRPRRLIPAFEIGRVSGQLFTSGQPGDGWYFAIGWLGRTVIIETLRGDRG